MERRSHIQHHPHQESRKGFPVYASTTRMKSTSNESKDFQLLTKHNEKGKNPHPIAQSIIFNKNNNRYFIPFRDDEDSDERSIYFGKQNN